MKKLAIFLLLLGLSGSTPEGGVSWKRVNMDGSRTGVTIPTADNVKEALGTVSGNVYKAPNGRVFKDGSTPKVASLMVDAQETMASVKEIVGYSPAGMKRHRPECELSDWFCDFLISKTAELTDRQVDLSIYNFGGIRADMPQGNVTVDDVMSMFPFRNTLCYVALKGADVRYIFQWLAQHGMQAVGGVKVTVKDGHLEELLVGGEPLDDKKTYGVATVSFLLDGGDGLKIARNSQELIITDVYVMDAVIPYVRALHKAGQPIEYNTDGRVTIIKSEEQ